MSLDEVRKVNNEAPFSPYEIHRADGRIARVLHPDFVGFSPTGRYLVVFHPDGMWETISTGHIVALQHTPAETAELP